MKKSDESKKYESNPFFDDNSYLGTNNTTNTNMTYLKANSNNNSAQSIILSSVKNISKEEAIKKFISHLKTQKNYYPIDLEFLNSCREAFSLSDFKLCGSKASVSDLCDFIYYDLELFNAFIEYDTENKFELKTKVLPKVTKIFSEWLDKNIDHIGHDVYSVNFFRKQINYLNKFYGYKNMYNENPAKELKMLDSSQKTAFLDLEAVYNATRNFFISPPKAEVFMNKAKSELRDYILSNKFYEATVKEQNLLRKQINDLHEMQHEDNTPLLQMLDENQKIHYYDIEAFTHIFTQFFTHFVNQFTIRLGSCQIMLEGIKSCVSRAEQELKEIPLYDLAEYKKQNLELMKLTNLYKKSYQEAKNIEKLMNQEVGMGGENHEVYMGGENQEVYMGGENQEVGKGGDVEEN